jgi:release factor glutamine methyltransferase
MTGSSFRAIATKAAARLGAAGVEEAQREAWLLLQAASGRSRAALIAHGEDRPDRAVLADFETMLARRLAREPIAYVLGEKEFWSLTFRVAPGVLIPRPDSETVVEAALDHLSDRQAPLRLLDLGTGTGCLLMALLSELPAARGIGVDRDALACAVAAGNARHLGLGDRALIVRGRWAEALRGPFDLIVANPPYVRTKERNALPAEVREHEPEHALFAGADGLDAYRELALQIVRLLGSGGLACLEHGHDQAPDVREIMAAPGMSVRYTRPDLAGHLRVTVLKKGAQKRSA